MESRLPAGCQAPLSHGAALGGVQPGQLGVREQEELLFERELRACACSDLESPGAPARPRSAVQCSDFTLRRLAGSQAKTSSCRSLPRASSPVPHHRTMSSADLSSSLTEPGPSGPDGRAHAAGLVFSPHERVAAGEVQTVVLLFHEPGQAVPHAGAFGAAVGAQIGDRARRSPRSRA